MSAAQEIEAAVLELVVANAIAGLTIDKAMRVLARRDRYVGCPDGWLFDGIYDAMHGLREQGRITREGERHFPATPVTA